MPIPATEGLPYSAKFWRENFWRSWHFPARPSKFNLSDYLKTIQRLQVYGERQWPSVKIFSIKYLKSRYPSNFPTSKFCAIWYFLGHIVSTHKITPDPHKISKVKEWPTPTTVKEIQQFLGLANYYWRFIQDFATIAKPLHRLTETTDHSSGQGMPIVF